MRTTGAWVLLGALAFAALYGCTDGLAQDGGEPGAGPVDEGEPDPDAEGEDGWPREIVTDDARFIVYQPQIDAFEGDVIEAHSAVAVFRGDDEEPRFAAVWFRARMETDREERVCRLFDAEVPRARFVDATDEEEEALAAVVRRELPGWVHPISMDRLLPALEAVEREREVDERFGLEPPRIVVTTTPALLVPVDGEPRLGPVEGSRVRRVVNTPVELLFEPSSRTWWIDAGASWIHSSAIDGPYRIAAAAPPEIAAVATSNAEEPRMDAGGEVSPGAVPLVILAREPTELVVLDGEPQWTAVVGEELHYAQNTSSILLRVASESRVYVLLSGRWFRTGSLFHGPWEFVAADALPECFADIPEGSEIGGVLAHVAGTELAEEALLDTMIPQTSAVRRDGAGCEVVYDGPPHFQPIPGTDLEWAVNTSSQVLLYRDRYYCCDQGVWFSATSPHGIWAVAVEVPQEFQRIPPDNPCHNVRYVVVYDATPQVVYVGYTPGYLGCYAWRGTVVWGTGWRYPCWYGDFWYPRCATWGVSVGYAPWDGHWFVGLGFSCPGGWTVGVRAYRGWGWGGAWWGPCGYARPRHVVVHRPVVYGPGFRTWDRREPSRRHVNVYNAPRNRPRVGPDRLERRPSSRRPAPRVERPVPPPARPAPERSAPPPRRPRNDVFADREGRIFRRNADGTWHQRDRDGWKPVPSTQRPPAPTPATRTGPRAKTPPSAPRSRRPVTRPPLRPAPNTRLQREAWGRDRGAVRTRQGVGTTPTPPKARGGGRKR